MTTRISKAVSVLVSLAVLMSFPMMSLALSEKLVGEVSVSGKSIDGEAPVVMINGEAAQSGRTILSGSTVSTSAGSTATLNFGKLGIIELAPKSTAVISLSANGISGDLLTGKISVLNAPENSVSFNTPAGMSLLNAGETASAAKDDDDAGDGSDGGGAWWLAAILIGGAVGGIIIASNSDDNRVALGGGTTVVSPTR